MEKTCPGCKKTFTSIINEQRFCSRSCGQQNRAPNGKRKIYNCLYCKKKITGTEAKKRKYCCRKHHDLSRRDRVRFSCLICGKSFTVYKARSKYYENHYCSLHCYYEKIKSNINLTCMACGKNYNRKISRTYIKKNGKKIKTAKNYCSFRCFLKDHRDQMVCTNCGKKFNRWKSQGGYGKKGWAFCSRECWKEYACYSNKETKRAAGIIGFNMKTVKTFNLENVLEIKVLQLSLKKEVRNAREKEGKSGDSRSY